MANTNKIFEGLGVDQKELAKALAEAKKAQAEQQAKGMTATNPVVSTVDNKTVANSKAESTEQATTDTVAKPTTPRPGADLAKKVKDELFNEQTMKNILG